MTIPTRRKGWRQKLCGGSAAAGLLLILSGGLVQADPPQGSNPKVSRPAEKSTTAEPQQKRKVATAAVERSEQDLQSPLDEAAALAFAAQHHPELAALLRHMEKPAPREYRAGILDVEWSRQRLERTRERSPERYELELSEWKLNSQIRLLVARLAMGESPAQVAELKSLVRDRAAVRLQLLEDDRDRMTARLERLESQIAARRADADQIVEREVQNLVGSASAASARVANKPTGANSKKQATPSPASQKPTPSQSTTGGSNASAVKGKAPVPNPKSN